MLHIGYGSGGTTYAVSRHPVEQIDVVEISPDVVRVANQFFPEINRGAFSDPRVSFFWGDGRNYLLSTQRRYDVILSDSIHPSTAGNGNLYTLEYFRHAARRLEPGGIFSTWLPMYRLTPENFQQILKALADAFEHITIWYAHNTVNRWVVVTGSSDPDFELPGSSIDARFARPEVRSDLAELGYDHPLDLFDNLILGNRGARALLEDVEPHRDDQPRVEYESVVNSWDVWRNQTWRFNMTWLVGGRESFRDYLSGTGGWPARLVNDYAVASDLVVQGQLAYLSCRTRQALRLFRRAVRRLPQHEEPWDFEALGETPAPGCSLLGRPAQ